MTTFPQPPPHPSARQQQAPQSSLESNRERPNVGSAPPREEEPPVGVGGHVQRSGSAPPRPPPQHSYGSTLVDSMSGLTPPSAAATVPVVTHLASSSAPPHYYASTASNNPRGQVPGVNEDPPNPLPNPPRRYPTNPPPSRFPQPPPPPPPRQGQGLSTAPNPPLGGAQSAPSSGAVFLSPPPASTAECHDDGSAFPTSGPSSSPPYFVGSGQSQYRTLHVPSSSVQQSAAAVSPNPAFAPNLYGNPDQDHRPPPATRTVPMPPPIHLPSPVPTTASPPTTANAHLPHPVPNPHHPLRHNRGVPPPPLPPPPNPSLPPPPPTTVPNYGMASQMGPSRPVAPVPDFAPSTNLPNFTPKADPRLRPNPTPPPPPPATAAPHRPHLDMSQLPRPPVPTAPQLDDGRVPVYETRQSLQGIVPPLADTRFVVMDPPGNGNASPLVMRPTLYCVPQNRGVWHETGDVPFAVLCTPLALHSDDYVPPPRILPDGRSEEWRDRNRVPLVPKEPDADAASGGPPRCPSCQAYPTPFSRDGSECAMCGHRGTRNVILSTPYSTVEYEVDGPYETRDQPVQPVFLYAIDLTSPHALEYVSVLERVAADLHFHWQRQPSSTISPVGTAEGGAAETPLDAALLPRIGVCLFSANGVVLRSLHGKGNYCVMCDVTEDPFCPLPLHDWTIDVSTEAGFRQCIVYLKEQLGHDISFWRDQLKGGNAYGLDNFDLTVSGAALQFLASALSESGGRGTILSWRRPNFGVGKLSHREERKVSAAGRNEDYASYTPVQLLSKFKAPSDESASQFYRRLGGDCATSRVSLNVIMHCDPSMGQTFLDVATLGELCRMTCGKLAWIPVSKGWKTTMQEEFRRQVHGFSGSDAVFKVRTSAGVQVKSFVCNPGVVQESMLGSQELELPHASPATTIAVELDYRVGGIPKGNKYVFVQSALLYTTVHSQRRVRVTTLALPISSIAQEVFRSIDFSATAAMLMRVNASRLHQVPSDENMTSPRANARASVYHECLHILSSFRKVSGAGATDQPVLPETLHLLPLVVMCLLKSPLLRPTLMMNPTPRPGAAPRDSGLPSVVIRPSADERAYFHLYASQASPTTAMLLAYPRLYPVGALESAEVAEWVDSPGGPESASGFVYLPDPLRPSMEVLQDDGMYLVDNGMRYFLWIGKQVPDHIREQARNLSLSDWNPVAHRVLWQLDAFNNADRGHMSEARPVQPPLLVVAPQDGNVQTPIESMVLDLMIEDAIGGEKDYPEFFLRTHNNVRNRLKAQQ